MPALRVTPGKRAGSDGKFTLGGLSDLLDTIVAMHWDLTNGLHDGGDLPTAVTTQIESVDRELKAAIATLKALLDERGASGGADGGSRSGDHQGA